MGGGRNIGLRRDLRGARLKEARWRGCTARLEGNAIKKTRLLRGFNASELNGTLDSVDDY